MKKALNTRTLREWLGLTQLDMGALMGYNMATINYIEAGTRPISPRFEEIILSKFGVNPGWWRGADDEAMFLGQEPRYTDEYMPNRLRFILHRVREDEGITDKDIADKVGLSTATIRDILNGNMGISPEIIDRFSETFHINKEYLVN